jgi:hypothetical protein
VTRTCAVIVLETGPAPGPVGLRTLAVPFSAQTAGVCDWSSVPVQAIVCPSTVALRGGQGSVSPGLQKR